MKLKLSERIFAVCPKPEEFADLPPYKQYFYYAIVFILDKWVAFKLLCLSLTRRG